MNKIFSPRLITLVALLVCLAPQSLFAAELNFKVIPGKAGDTDTVVEVRVDPQSKNLNVVEGAIRFSGPVTEDMSVQIENGNSILTLWPTPPQYEPSEKTVNFAGGVPAGFDDESLLFIMRISSPVVGDLDITYTDGYAYLNDGLGTMENVYSEPLNISLNQPTASDTKEENPLFNQSKYVILVLISMLLGFFVFYGYKKIAKK